ncbi:MAG: hypothetical protein AAF757_15665 [Cyanobacteria bacterium P01_D01_bin.116]
MAKKPIKSNLLLVTCYLLLVTCYLLLVTLWFCGSWIFSQKYEGNSSSSYSKPGSVKITVRCLGVTENGNLWHGRFIGLCE